MTHPAIYDATDAVTEILEGFGDRVGLETS
jgi:hypothetical protein